jgi:hypothetical protein
VKSKPVRGLTFSWADGSSGATTDYLGRQLAIVVVSLDCVFCKQSMEKIRDICRHSNISYLALADRSRPREDSPEESQIEFPKAFAALPEIYLGLDVPRGTWIKFPTLVILDEAGQVAFFCNDRNKLLDDAFLEAAFCFDADCEGTLVR